MRTGREARHRTAHARGHAQRRRGRIQFLGADTPAASAISFAESAGASILCFSASRTESVSALHEALAATTSPVGPALVVGGAAVTPTIARRLRGTYGDARLDVAVARLRKLADR